jgi:8-oxo-dGTP diphosphatase
MQQLGVLDENQIYDQAKKDGVTHISTGVAIVRDKKILMVRRASDDFLGGNYELPGGGVDDGESIIECAIREVREETGLTISKVINTFAGFDYSTDRKPHVRQVNFIVEVKKGDVRLDPNEHSEYKWVDNDNIDDISMSDEIKTCVREALNIINI